MKVSLTYLRGLEVSELGGGGYAYYVKKRLDVRKPGERLVFIELTKY